MTLREYPMSRQPVPVYRQTESGRSRPVLSGCYVEEQDTRRPRTVGQEGEQTVRLIGP